MSSNANKPASPIWHETSVNAAGLTKLEYAAVHIMSNLCGSQSIHDGGLVPKQIAEMATTAARALFAELEKRQ